MKLDLKQYIRDVPDWPKKGVIFKDITTLVRQPAAFRQAIDQLAAHYKDRRVDLVASVEARGFIFGAALAYAVGAGFIAARKPGKLPRETVEATYALEYGTDSLQVHRDAMTPGSRVVVLDDVLATGGTAKAKVELVESLGAIVVGVVFVIELSFLNGRERLAGYDVHSLITY